MRRRVILPLLLALLFAAPAAHAAKVKFGKATWKVYKNKAKKVLSCTKAGKVKVKKGTKAGTYVIKLKANVKSTSNYNAIKNKVVTVTVKVK